MIKGIHHISIISSSEDSVSFYKSIGFEEISRIQRDHDTVVLFKGLGVDLEMFLDPKHPSHSFSPETLGIRFISFKTDDIEATVKKLNLKAEPIQTDWFNQRYCFIKDPDGLLIQLHE